MIGPWAPYINRVNDIFRANIIYFYITGNFDKNRYNDSAFYISCSVTDDPSKGIWYSLINTFRAESEAYRINYDILFRSLTMAGKEVILRTKAIEDKVTEVIYDPNVCFEWDYPKAIADSEVYREYPMDAKASG